MCEEEKVMSEEDVLPAKLGEVIDQVGSLSSGHKRLGKAVISLRKKLSPILSPASEEKAPEGKELISGSEVTVRLKEENMKLQGFINEILNIVDRAEL